MACRRHEMGLDLSEKWGYFLDIFGVSGDSYDLADTATLNAGEM